MSQIAYRIDDELKVSLVRGEDRILAIRLMDAKSLAPIDLTGAIVSVDFKGDDDRILRRSSATKSFVDAGIDVEDNTIYLAEHGLVNGEVIRFTTSGVLPTGLALATDYYVTVVDKDTIKVSLTDGGDAVNITAASGGGTHQMATTHVEIEEPEEIGMVLVALSDAFTEALLAGANQDFELEYTISSSTRIVQFTKALSVIEQVSA
jgi:hypothetical protein